MAVQSLEQPLVHECTFRSIYGMIERIKDCGKSSCPYSDSYVPDNKNAGPWSALEENSLIVNADLGIPEQFHS